MIRALCTKLTKREMKIESGHVSMIILMGNIRMSISALKNHPRTRKHSPLAHPKFKILLHIFCFDSILKKNVKLMISVIASLVHPSTTPPLVSTARLAQKTHGFVLMMSGAKTSLIWLHTVPPFPPLFGIEEMRSDLKRWRAKTGSVQGKLFDSQIHF